MKAIYLKPYSAMAWIPPSDSIYGMIFTAMSAMKPYYDIEKILKGFIDGNPQFLISSAFPYTGSSDGRIHYLPKPLSIDTNKNVTCNSVEEYRELKRYKKQNLITDNEFNYIAKGKFSDKENLKKIQSKEPYQSVDVMHNGINRLTGTVTESILFEHREYVFAKDSGCYFLVKGDSDLLHGALNFLSDFGIGGNNSIGKGQFRWSIADAKFLKENPEGDSFVTLSRYLPAEDEIESICKSDKAFYLLEHIRGTLGTHWTGNSRIWKKSVTVFSPGSVFPNGKKSIYGAVAQVKDLSEGIPHPVYYTGYAFNIKIKGDGI
ncbi:MAG TPA: type III-A CRISPR-associated RAMP protein Csm4 [Spirochaetota bacterium]|nr:type III-A CRISPR-associated RAMP protein Csm4 [Spirochaetota bacterium]